MKKRFLFLALTLSLAGSQHTPCEAKGGDSWSSMKGVRKKLAKEGAWDLLKGVTHAVRVGFYFIRRPNTYELEAEDRFLLGFFKAFLDKGYEAEASLAASGNRRIPQHHLKSIKENAIRSFASRLRRLPREPYLIEKLGLLPVIISAGSIIFAIVSRFYSLQMQLKPMRLIIASLVLFALQIIAKAHRLIGRRFPHAYQGWMESNLAEQRRVERSMKPAFSYEE